jgi:hypothetical protein
MAASPRGGKKPAGRRTGGDREFVANPVPETARFVGHLRVSASQDLPNFLEKFPKVC